MSAAISAPGSSAELRFASNFHQDEFKIFGSRRAHRRRLVLPRPLLSSHLCAPNSVRFRVAEAPEEMLKELQASEIPGYAFSALEYLLLPLARDVFHANP
jgi:hypothetical protein